MKNLVLAGLVLFSTNVFASKMVNIKTFTNPAILKAEKEVSKLEFINYTGGKKVLQLKASGSTLQEQRQKTIAQALHTLCPFFDEGVSLGLASKDESGVEDAAYEFEYYIDGTENAEASMKAFKSMVRDVNLGSDIEVFSGGASGNNTSGAVMGIYDLKNQEIFIMAATNCGRDS